jgi:ATP/maltotriose-dependent transcriptional regulator MalT
MPKSFRRGVRWDRQAASYQVIEQAGNKITASHLDFPSHVWQQWLEQVSSFAFQSKDGQRFTARKETRARGDAYWIAYRKIDGKLTHKYLGRTTDVTLSKLEQVAATLAGQEIQATISELMDGHRESSMQEPLAEQLLATKFFVPSSPHVLVSRPRLSTLLDEGLQRPLTVVSAPAGFGKTTLLSEWVQALSQESIQVAWVSLDEGDNEPVRFWRYVLTALDRLQPGMCIDLVTLLRTQTSPPLPYLLTTLINRLVRSTRQILLVLDDYHVITDQAVQASFTSLVEHLPTQLRVVLSTRVDPPLPLSRLRACSQLLEVRTEQLRCTDTEVADFLREIVGVELSSSEVEQVTSRTGGWLVSLQMLDLSLRRSEDPFHVQGEVRGSHRHILDYLTEEVLRQQPPAMQRFLLRTSILERLTAPLCDAVLEQSGSQQVLEELKRTNLFLISLDSQRRWYRYHPLFAEVLRFWLERVDSEALEALHLRASEWFAGQGYADEAVQHAIHARDWSQAADLIEAKMQTPDRGRWEEATLQHWIAQLPPEVVRTRPRLCLASALPRSASSPTVDIRLEPAAEPAAPAVPTSKLVRVHRPVLQTPPQQNLLDPLSLRELEVLHLMAQGATNGEIALTLALAVETIKRHESNILSKLGVGNRTQAAARAYKLGLLCGEP